MCCNQWKWRLNFFRYHQSFFSLFRACISSQMISFWIVIYLSASVFVSSHSTSVSNSFSIVLESTPGKAGKSLDSHGFSFWSHKTRNRSRNQPGDLKTVDTTPQRDHNTTLDRRTQTTIFCLRLVTVGCQCTPRELVLLIPATLNVTQRNKLCSTLYRPAYILRQCANSSGWKTKRAPSSGGPAAQQPPIWRRKMAFTSTLNLFQFWLSCERKGSAKSNITFVPQSLVRYVCMKRWGG